MRKRFTDEEITKLAANPNTLSVTETTLMFTAEFKELLWTRYKLGERPDEVFKECGYNPELIGPKRIENTIYLIRQKKQNGESVPEGHSGKRKSTRGTDVEYELKYLRQENEFLKKLYLLQTGKPYDPSK